MSVARVHSTTLQPFSSNQCNTASLESKLTCWFKTCSPHSMRLNTRFQARLNASYTDDHAIVQTTTPWYTEWSRFFSATLPHSPLLSSFLTIVKNNHFSANYIFFTTAYIFATMSFDEFWPWQIFSAIKDNKTVHFNYARYVVNHNWQTSSQKHKSPPRLTAFLLTKSFVLSLSAHMLQPSNNSTEIWFKRGIWHLVLLYIYFT